jgi:hypothetical protein
MPKVLETWTVQPHDPLQEVADGLLSVIGEIVMPLGRFPRRMTVARLAGNRTAIWSAIALDEPEMARIEAMGLPAVLIVPNDAHRLDAAIWKRRYPEIKVLTPRGARDAVAEVVPVDATDDMLEDPQVRFVTVPGTCDHESALIVARDGETSLIVNDIIAHVAHPHGLGAHVMARLFDFGVSAPATPSPVRRKIVDDPIALAAQFRAWAELPGLARIMPSHGEIMSKDPAATLATLARALE